MGRRAAEGTGVTCVHARAGNLAVEPNGTGERLPVAFAVARAVNLTAGLRAASGALRRAFDDARRNWIGRARGVGWAHPVRPTVAGGLHARIRATVRIGATVAGHLLRETRARDQRRDGAEGDGRTTPSHSSSIRSRMRRSEPRQGPTRRPRRSAAIGQGKLRQDLRQIVPRDDPDEAASVHDHDAAGPHRDGVAGGAVHRSLGVELDGFVAHDLLDGIPSKVGG